VENVNKKDLKHFEQRLLEERNKLLEQMSHLEKDVLSKTLRDSSGDLSAYTFHMADLGTDAMEREKAFLFASSEGRLLYHINEALRRLYRDEYGNCESCGAPISKERLEIVPHARLCIKCKEKEEKTAKKK
jgi:DnaK suppressor protein